MFDRYNIIDAADLARAVRRRFTENDTNSGANGNQTATISAGDRQGR